jgi:hypothetical protein
MSQQIFFIPAVSVDFAGSITGGIWPLVPLPNSSNVGGFLKQFDRKPKLAKLVELVDASKPGSNDNGIK